MTYEVKQDQKHPYDLSIHDEAGEILRLPLVVSDGDTIEEANARPENQPARELAQRVQLSLEFCASAQIMSLAMGVRTGGLQALANKLILQEQQVIDLKAVAVTMLQTLKDTKGKLEDRANAVVGMLEGLGYHQDPKVIEAIQKADGRTQDAAPDTAGA